MNCDPARVHTNMVFITLDDPNITDRLVSHLADANIAVLGGTVIRLVTHMDIDRNAVDRLINLCEDFITGIGIH